MSLGGRLVWIEPGVVWIRPDGVVVVVKEEPMTERKPSDHYLLGAQDRIAGRPRYRFQDPRLQVEYDRAYDGDAGEVLGVMIDAGEWPRHRDRE